MPTSQLDHPTTQQLAQFTSGKLNSLESGDIERHLAACESCCQLLKTLPDDTLVSLLRGESDTTVEGRSQSESQFALTILPQSAHATIPPSANLTVGPKAGNAALTDVPAGLREHPRYRVVSLLGQGGMGSVYQAEHRMMRRSVALKVINPQLVQNATAVERFHREVQAAAKLAHPNIVAAYDAEQAADAHFLVMEFVPGEDLAAVVQKQGRLSVETACEYVRQAALGLAHAHERGMVHRDIKPQNLMLTTGGQVKILDFGLAQFASEIAEVSGLTQMGAIMGTPDYMAPEQARDAHSADIRADIYSLGCTLYCLLTGSTPFTEATSIGKIMAHAEREPTPLAQLNPSVPAELAKVVQKMMAKQADQRYQTPTEVAEALAPFALAAPSTRPAKPGPLASSPDFTRASLAIIASIALALLGGLGAVIVVATNQGRIEIQSDVDDVEIVVKQGGKEIAIIDTQTGSQVKWLPSGKYEVELKENRNDLEIDRTGFTLSRLGKQIVRLKRKTDARVVADQSPDSSFSQPQEVRRFEGHEGPVRSLTFSRDGKWALTGSGYPHGDNTLRLWEVATGKQLRLFTDSGLSWVMAVALSPDGTRALSGSWDGVVRLWDVETGKVVKHLRGHGDMVQCVAFSPDGNRALSAAGGKDMTVRLWDLTLGTEMRQLSGHSDAVTSLAFLPDGKQAVTCAWAGDSTIRLWNIDSGAELRRYPGHPGGVHSVAVSADGQFLLSGGKDGKARYTHMQSGELLKVLEGHAEQVNMVAFFPDGRRALTCSNDRTVRVWDLVTGVELGSMPSHAGTVWSAAVAPSGEQVLSASEGVWSNERWLSLDDLAPRLWRVPAPPAHQVAQVRQFATWLEFDGTSSYVAIPSLVRNDITQPITLETWVQAANDVSSGVVVVVGGKGRCQLHQARENWHGLGSYDGQELMTPLTIGEFTHLALVNTRKEMRLYVDGNLALRRPLNTNKELTTTGRSHAEIGGHESYHGAGLTGFPFEGKIAGVRVSKSALYDKDFTPPHQFTADANTLALYRFDEGQGAVLRDSSGNGHHGKIVGARWAGANSSPPVPPKNEWAGWPKDAPPPAIAPFNTEQANQYQEAWAKHLAVPVEYTNSIGMKFRLIPPGEFLMGSTQEEVDEALPTVGANEPHIKPRIAGEMPSHHVVLTKPFYLGMHEVSQKDYETVQGKNPASLSATGKFSKEVEGLDTSRFPVETVSWNDALEFCSKLSLREGKVGGSYRLPTEAEWEFACRAGTQTRFWFGDSEAGIERFAWCFPASQQKRSIPVGSLLPNPFGLFDVSGNVNEWCHDWYHTDYYRQFENKPAIDPAGPPESTGMQVARGGYFYWIARACRSADRAYATPVDYKWVDVGFRAALSVEAVRKAVEKPEAKDSAQLDAPPQDWISLFNGKDLTGWTQLPRGNGNWSVENEALVGTGGMSFLVYERAPHTNVNLRLEAKVSGSGSALAAVRVSEPDGKNDHTFTGGYAVSLDSRPPENGWATGSLVRLPLYRVNLLSREKSSLVPADTWCTVEILAEGDRIRTFVDGKLVSDVEDKKDPYSRGRIGLGLHQPGVTLHVRKIEMRELQDTRPAAIAPFDAAQAKQHQESWAKHLGLPVEYTNSLGMKFRLIPPGEFTMGTRREQVQNYLASTKDRRPWKLEALPMESPEHQVRLTRPLYLGVHEVTLGQFRIFAEETGYKTDSERAGGGWGMKGGQWVPDAAFVWNGKNVFAQAENHPVLCLSWLDAEAYRTWLSQKLKGEYTLPTEAQWEFASRAGHTGELGFDNPEQLGQHAWFDENSDNRTHAVGEKLANSFGIFDLQGNAWEWCLDGFAAYPQEGVAIDPAPQENRRLYATRGGAFDCPDDVVRPAFRYGSRPDGGNFNFGMRLALTVESVLKEVGAVSATQAKQPTGTNLITDPSLEFTAIGEKYPQGWGSGNLSPAGAYTTAVVEGGRTGKHSWKVAGDGKFAVIPTNRVPVDRTRRYGGRAWVRLEDGAAQLKLLYFDGTNRYIGENVGAMSASGDWLLLSISDDLAAHPTAQRLSLAVSLIGKGTAVFDDLELQAFDTKELPADFAQQYAVARHDPALFDRWVGQWQTEAEYRATAATEAKTVKGNAVVRKVLDDQFLLTQWSAAAEDSQSLSLQGFDENLKAYRFWMFASNGEAYERLGQWNASESLLSLSLRPPARGVSGLSTDHFQAADRVESTLLIKNSQGVVRDLQANWKRTNSKVPESVSLDTTRAAEPQELAQLEPTLGRWAITAQIKPCVWFPEGKTETVTELASWICGGRLLLTQGFDDKQRPITLAVTVYEPRERAFRYWMFSKTNYGGQWQIAWEEATRTFHMRATDMPEGWSGNARNRLLDDGTFECQILVKDEQGRVLLDMTQNKKLNK